MSLVKIITNTTEFKLDKKTAAAIGKFDGVHIGHRRLLEEITTRKRDGLAACVFTFDPPPAVFFGRTDGKLLNTITEKRIMFEKLGVDILIEFPLNPETAAMEPECFAEEILAKRMNVAYLAAGSDLSFGAKGAGNAALLRKLAPELGFEVETIDKVCVEGEEVSSTLVRERMESGNMEYVSALLGMPYMIAGKVIDGNKIGRTIGFPTVNIQPEESKLLPPNGVYFSEVCVAGKTYSAISNIGCKPTVTNQNVLGVETFIYDFNQMIYDENIEIYLHKFHRAEQRFEGVEVLKKQLQEDVCAGKAFWESKNIVKKLQKYYCNF